MPQQGNPFLPSSPLHVVAALSFTPHTGPPPAPLQLKELFLRNAHVEDVRVVDMLTIKVEQRDGRRETPERQTDGQPLARAPLSPPAGPPARFPCSARREKWSCRRRCRSGSKRPT